MRGRWLWTGERLIERGGVRIAGGEVAAIIAGNEPDPPGAEALDLPGALVHPGLFDAHCHLDLSGLGGAIPEGLPFSRWLLSVRELRKGLGEAGLAEAAVRGARDLIEGGATAVVDFSHGGLSEGAVRACGIRAAILHEVIGPSPARAVEAESAAREWLASRDPHPLVAHGLAPHSPYLVTASLLRGCRRLAARRPFSIHAAEIPGERELLLQGTGDLRDLLVEAGVDLSGFEPPGQGPISYLDSLGALEGTLIVHAGSLEPPDLSLLRRRGAAVVFCPRSHRYFGRPPHPLPSLLEAGVPAALGTDSAASGGILSVAAEMREARRSFPALSPRTVWDLGTGALLPPGGLGLPWRPGLLAPGRPADLAAAELAPGAGDPLAAFLDETPPCVLTMVGGRKIW